MPGMIDEVEGTPTHNLSRPDYYEIRVIGQMASDWPDWFDGLTVTSMESGETILYGPFVDQAALHGLLAYLQNRELFLISIKRIIADEID